LKKLRDHGLAIIKSSDLDESCLRRDFPPLEFSGRNHQGHSVDRARQNCVFEGQTNAQKHVSEGCHVHCNAVLPAPSSIIVSACCLPRISRREVRSTTELSDDNVVDCLRNLPGPGCQKFRNTQVEKLPLGNADPQRALKIDRHPPETFVKLTRSSLI
jgi:hypothetical protein